MGRLAYADRDIGPGQEECRTVQAYGVAFVYAGVMVVRYGVRMARRPAERWFGGAIPIVFHWVLAAYLVVFGTFHVSG